MFQNLLNQFGAATIDGYQDMMLDVDARWHAPLPRGRKIIAPNHPTTTDPFHILPLIHEPVSILVTEFAFKVPGFGGFLRQAGHVEVVATNGAAAFARALELLRAEQSIVLFPEGALSPGLSEPGKPRTGAVRLAMLADAPIVPVGIGVLRERVVTRAIRAGNELETARWYLRGPYGVTFGEAQHLAGDVNDRAHVRQASSDLIAAIRALSAESTKRMIHRETYLEAERAERRARIAAWGSSLLQTGNLTGGRHGAIRA